jgi:hypothetical protein
MELWCISNDNLCELWHKCLGHLHYGALPLLKDMVVGLLDFKVERKECARDVHLTSMPRLLSQAVSIDREGFLIWYI